MIYQTQSQRGRLVLAMEKGEILLWITEYPLQILINLHLILLKILLQKLLVLESLEKLIRKFILRNILLMLLRKLFLDLVLIKYLI